MDLPNKAGKTIPHVHVAYKEFDLKSRNQPRLLFVFGHYLGTGLSK